MLVKCCFSICDNPIACREWKFTVLCMGDFRKKQFSLCDDDRPRQVFLLFNYHKGKREKQLLSEVMLVYNEQYLNTVVLPHLSPL